MGLGGYSSRSLINLSYAFQVNRKITDARSLMYERAGQAQTSPSRQDEERVVEDAVRDFDYSLTVQLDEDAGVTMDRVMRARANARALQGLRQGIEIANRAAE